MKNQNCDENIFCLEKQYGTRHNNSQQTYTSHDPQKPNQNKNRKNSDEPKSSKRLIEQFTSFQAFLGALVNTTADDKNV